MPPVVLVCVICILHAGANQKTYKLTCGASKSSGKTVSMMVFFS
jgi:hypothetical protein